MHALSETKVAPDIVSGSLERDRRVVCMVRYSISLPVIVTWFMRDGYAFAITGWLSSGAEFRRRRVTIVI
jgi:hypothetical protein